MNKIKLELSMSDIMILIRLLEANKNLLLKKGHEQVYKKLVQALDKITIENLGLSKESDVFYFST